MLEKECEFFLIVPSITITLFLDNGLQSGEKAYHIAIL